MLRIQCFLLKFELWHHGLLDAPRTKNRFFSVPPTRILFYIQQRLEILMGASLSSIRTSFPLYVGLLIQYRHRVVKDSVCNVKGTKYARPRIRHRLRAANMAA